MCIFSYQELSIFRNLFRWRRILNPLNRWHDAAMSYKTYTRMYVGGIY